MKFIDSFSVRVADIPGLVENSFEKKGLGIEFLRHCTRVKLFAFVLDMGPESKVSPLDQFRILRSEIGKYDPKL